MEVDSFCSQHQVAVQRTAAFRTSALVSIHSNIGCCSDLSYPQPRFSLMKRLFCGLFREGVGLVENSVC